METDFEQEKHTEYSELLADALIALANQADTILDIGTVILTSSVFSSTKEEYQPSLTDKANIENFEKTKRYADKVKQIKKEFLILNSKPQAPKNSDSLQNFFTKQEVSSLTSLIETANIYTTPVNKIISDTSNLTSQNKIAKEILTKELNDLYNSYFTVKDLIDRYNKILSNSERHRNRPKLPELQLPNKP